MSAAGIGIRTLDTVDGVHAAAALFDAVWAGDRATMPANILRALEHSGNYVVGVFDGDRMIGASAAFFGPPAARTLHSHITGVLPGRQGRGLGRLLKEHQRRWALDRGIRYITWTFDPLIRRNAYFNLSVLGATAVEYLTNQYGEMPDDVNRGDASDRLLVRWDIAAPSGTARTDEVLAAVAVPPDVEALRRSDPDAARAWRTALRGELRSWIDGGHRIVGFDVARGYLVAAE